MLQRRVCSCSKTTLLRCTCTSMPEPDGEGAKAPVKLAEEAQGLNADCRHCVAWHTSTSVIEVTVAAPPRALTRRSCLHEYYVSLLCLRLHDCAASLLAGLTLVHALT